jgi:hypothetical protein
VEADLAHHPSPCEQHAEQDHDAVHDEQCRRGTFNDVDESSSPADYAPPEADLIVCEDDVALRRSSIRHFAHVARNAGSALAQPSPIADSFAFHGFTRDAQGSTARQMHFVEIGPLLFLAVAVRPSSLPFPEDCALGCGVNGPWNLSILR